MFFFQTTPGAANFANVPFAGQSPAQGQAATEFAAGNYTLVIQETSGNNLFFKEVVPVSAGSDLIYTVVRDPAPVNSNLEILAVPLEGDPFTLESDPMVTKAVQ